MSLEAAIVIQVWDKTFASEVGVKIFNKEYKMIKRKK
jgi:hypothetical protein